jgi:hypothetical protein
MRRNRSWLGLEPALMILILGSVHSSVQADAITIPGYTVTDLGAGMPTYSTDANGNGVLNAPSGQVYAFSQTPNTVLVPGQGIGANLPYLPPPSASSAEVWPSPNSVWSYDGTVVMNSNGIAATIYVSGVGDHYYTDQAYYVQHNANGSWGAPVTILRGAEQPAATGAPFTFNIVGLSAANQILINNGTSEPSQAGAMLYNINTSKMVYLAGLLDSASPNYIDAQGVAIDDDGRILLSAAAFNPNVGFTQTNLLLTPDGLSAAPLEVPAPEPASLAVMLLAIAGFAWHRRRERHQTA